MTRREWWDGFVACTSIGLAIVSAATFTSGRPISGLVLTLMLIAVQLIALRADVARLARVLETAASFGRIQNAVIQLDQAMKTPATLRIPVDGARVAEVEASR